MVKKGDYGFLVEQQSDSDGKLNQVFKAVDIYISQMMRLCILRRQNWQPALE